MSIISSSTLTFLITKAHAKRARSPNEQQVNAMINAKNIYEVENILSSTAYGEIIDKNRPSIDLPNFEIAVRRDYADLLNLYITMASGDVKAILRAFSLTIEAENMSTILQAIIRGTVNEELLEQIIIPIGKSGMRHYKRMMQVTNIDGAIDLIHHPALRRAARHAIARTNNKEDQVFYLTSALSHASFSELAKLVPDWISLRTEFFNLETICRTVKLGFEPEDWMITQGNGLVYKMKDTLKSLNTPQEIISVMLPNFPIKRPLREALEAPSKDVVAVLEDKALGYLYNQHRRRFMIYGSRKESILDFFEIKLAEIEDISRILLGKIKNIPPEKLKNMQYPIYRR